MILSVPIRESAIALATAALMSAAILPQPAGAYDLEAAAKSFRETNLQTPQPVKVLRGWEGGDSAITEFSFERVADPERWTALWQKHAPGVTTPPLDFAKEMVVAMFGGTIAGNIPRISLYAVTESDSIEVTTMNFVNDRLSNSSANLYLLMVLPLSPKPIVIVGRSYGLMRNPQHQYRVIGEIKELPGGR